MLNTVKEFDLKFKAPVNKIGLLTVNEMDKRDIGPI